MDKIYTRFKTKKAQNHTLWGGTYLSGLYKGDPPPPPPVLTLDRNIVLYENQTCTKTDSQLPIDPDPRASLHWDFK